MLFKTNKEIFFCIRNMRTQCWLKLCSNLQNFTPVCLLLTLNKLMPPGKRSMSLQHGIQMLKISNKNTTKKCEFFSRGKLFREKCLEGNFMSGKFHRIQRIQSFEKKTKTFEYLKNAIVSSGVIFFIGNTLHHTWWKKMEQRV